MAIDAEVKFRWRGKPLLRDYINHAVSPGLAEAADNVIASASVLVPVRTGKLRASLRRDPPAKGHRTKVVVIGGSFDVFYARFVEFGTRYMSPRRFLLRAVQRNRHHVPTLIRKHWDRRRVRG